MLFVQLWKEALCTEVFLHQNKPILLLQILLQTKLLIFELSQQARAAGFNQNSKSSFGPSPKYCSVKKSRNLFEAKLSSKLHEEKFDHSHQRSIHISRNWINNNFTNYLFSIETYQKQPLTGFLQKVCSQISHKNRKKKPPAMNIPF